MKLTWLHLRNNLIISEYGRVHCQRCDSIGALCYSALQTRYFYDVYARSCLRQSSDMAVFSRLFDTLEACEAYCSVNTSDACPPVNCPFDCPVSVVKVSDAISVVVLAA